MNFDRHRHIFQSPKFQSVVDDAIKFFSETPVHKLPPLNKFTGAGVYILYYVGKYELYSRISESNRDAPLRPIYVGKAVPPGWRTARVKDTQSSVLYQRLREHAKSIGHSSNLEVDDFLCRFMILSGLESDLWSL